MSKFSKFYYEHLDEFISTHLFSNDSCSNNWHFLFSGILEAITIFLASFLRISHINSLHYVSVVNSLLRPGASSARSMYRLGRQTPFTVQ